MLNNQLLSQEQDQSQKETSSQQQNSSSTTLIEQNQERNSSSSVLLSKKSNENIQNTKRSNQQKNSKSRDGSLQNTLNLNQCKQNSHQQNTNQQNNFQQNKFQHNTIDQNQSQQNYGQLNALNLQNQGIKVISGINHYSSIFEIDLSHNQILKIQNIDKLTMITSLDLSHNKIIIIENLQELINLQYLNLSHNQIKVFPITLTKNHNLRTLNLSYNSIENEDCFRFMGKFVNLNNLDLSFNPISKSCNYQTQILNAKPTLAFLDGKPIQGYNKRLISSYFENKENIKNICQSSLNPIINDQEFKRILKNHENSNSSLSNNLLKMINDMSVQNNSSQQLSQNATNSSNTLHLDSSFGGGIFNRGSALNLSSQFQSMKRVPFKEIKQSDQKSDSFSNQLLFNGQLLSQIYNSKFDSNIKVNNFLSPQTKDNIILDTNSKSQFVELIQLSQQHTPRDETTTNILNNKKEDFSNFKYQKSEEMKAQCLEYQEKWEQNHSVFYEQLNLFFLQKFQELIEKVYSLITLTNQVASLIEKQKIIKVEIIQRLEKVLKQPFHPQQIAKKAIELLEIPKRSEQQEEIIAVQRNCEQIIFVIHNMKLRLLKDLTNDSKSIGLINQIYNNINDLNSLYVNIKKITETGKILSSSIFQKFLLFFKYHIKDSSESIACIQSEIDLNETLRDLLFSNDENQLQKFILPFDKNFQSSQKKYSKSKYINDNRDNNQSKITEKSKIFESNQSQINENRQNDNIYQDKLNHNSINETKINQLNNLNKNNMINSTPILKELDAYLHNIKDPQEDFSSSRKQNQINQVNTTETTVNPFHSSNSKEEVEDSQLFSIKDRNENQICTRCQEANYVMHQQQTTIDTLYKEIHLKNHLIQEKDIQIEQLKQYQEEQTNNYERKFLENSNLHEERYYQLKNSLISEEELFHIMNDQLLLQECIVEQNKEINSRIQEYNNYMIKLMSQKNDESIDFFKIILTQQAKSIEQMMLSNKQNSQLYHNLLKLVEEKTLPQMKLIPKSDASCQVNTRQSSQYNFKQQCQINRKSDQFTNKVGCPSTIKSGQNINRKPILNREFEQINVSPQNKKDNHSFINLFNRSQGISNQYPSSFLNTNNSSRKSSPNIDFQKELLKRKQSMKNSNQILQHCNNEKVFTPPYKLNTEEDEGQQVLYSFSQQNNGSREKESVASGAFQNPQKQANEFSLISYSNQTFSYKKSPHSNENEISFLCRSSNFKQKRCNGFSRSLWNITEQSKKQDINDVEVTDISEISRNQNDNVKHNLNEKQLNQFNSPDNYRNFFQKINENINQDFQLNDNTNNLCRKNEVIQQGGQLKQQKDQQFNSLKQFDQVKQFDPFNNQKSQQIKDGETNHKNKLDINSKRNSHQSQNENDGNKSARNEKGEKISFTFNSSLQQKIVSALQKKGLDQQKGKQNVQKNIGKSGFKNSQNSQNKNSSKTPKKKLNIDLNINLSGISNFQSKTATNQSNSQNKYFSYNCATTKQTSQLLYLNQQQSERNNLSQFQERQLKNMNPLSCRISNNTSQDERLKRSESSNNQLNFKRTNSIPSNGSSGSCLLDLNHYKVNQQKNFNFNNTNGPTNKQSNQSILGLSQNHTNENCDSLFHKRILKSNSESINDLNNSSKYSNKSKQNISNNSVNGVHAKYFNYQNQSKSISKQQQPEDEIINQYQLNHVKEKKQYQNQIQCQKKINNQYSNEPQLAEKRASFFENNQNYNQYTQQKQQ